VGKTGAGRNATEEIARAVKELADAERPANKPAQQFIESILGESCGTIGAAGSQSAASIYSSSE